MGCEAYDALFALMLAEGERMYGICWAGRSAEEAELEAVLAHPLFMVASDGLTLAPYGELASIVWHPTRFGWAARTLGLFVRERAVLTLEQAVQKITSLPAARLGLKERGLIKQGYWADLAVFDPRRISDRATLARPKEYPVGVSYVLVNGTVVVEEGRHTGARPGVVLRPQRSVPGGRQRALASLFSASLGRACRSRAARLCASRCWRPWQSRRPAAWRTGGRRPLAWPRA